MRIGHGYDVHRLVENRSLIIGGVEIEWTLGLDGHSDADVLLHAICDACLGAMAKGDIGQHFSPDDETWRDADSRVFIRHISNMMTGENYRLVNLDCTIVAEKPKMRPYLDAMRRNIADDMKVSIGQINIKATTTEGLGLCGRQEGIAAHAVVLIDQMNR